MKLPLSFALLPSLLMALNTTPVPSPKDSQNHNLPLADGGYLDDSTWTVIDTSAKVWYSRDKGTTWAAVPADSVGKPAEFFGSSVTAEDKWLWTFRDGWKRMNIPAAFYTSTDFFIGSEGMLGFFDTTTNLVSIYRSTDGLRNWSKWFSMDASLAPDAPNDYYGAVELGRLWFLVADSGYMRGTNDGTTWIRAVLPTDGVVQSIFPEHADTSLYVTLTNASGAQLATSSDLGTNWQLKPTDAPGAFVMQLGPALWASTTGDGENLGPLWLSHHPTGPWTAAPTDGVNGFFADGNTAYLATTQGILEMQIAETSVLPHQQNRAFAIHRQGTNASVETSKETIGSSWTLVAANGSVLDHGKATTGRFDISCPPTPAWLKLGSHTLRVPPL